VPGRFLNFYRSWHLEIIEHQRHHGPDEIDPDQVVDRLDAERRAVYSASRCSTRSSAA
jgi:hypothetical protein